MGVRSSGRSKSSFKMDQCALYKLSSKGKLCTLLSIDLVQLRRELSSPSYKQFTLPESICKYTQKRRRERFVCEPTGLTRKIHERLQYLIRRIATPDFVQGSVRFASYRDNAKKHCSQKELITLDIQNYYPSVSQKSVFHFFKDSLLCAPDVALVLAQLSCFEGKLPTGSPLSPILAVHASLEMFSNINSMALACGLRFTCYVDDLTFSGSRIPSDLVWKVQTIIRKFGFKLKVSKTKHYKTGQPRAVTGVMIVDDSVKVPFSRFKKYRKLRRAVQNAACQHEHLHILNKMGGLLGETAYLDSRYKNLAKRVYQEIADHKSKFFS